MFSSEENFGDQLEQQLPAPMNPILFSIQPKKNAKKQVSIKIHSKI
jgi:hypothetical protein